MIYALNIDLSSTDIYIKYFILKPNRKIKLDFINIIRILDKRSYIEYIIHHNYNIDTSK